VIFHEKLNFKFDVEAMREEFESVQKIGERVGVNDSAAFGGWSLQTQDGDWRSGFEKGGLRPDENGVLTSIERALPAHEYDKRTDACTGIFSDIIDELEEKGFSPARSRLTVLSPGQTTMWHTDAQDGNYSVRLHIPFITNLACAFEVQDEYAIHMPANGYAHLVDVGTTHRAYNMGTEIRMHFLAQVWPTEYSEHFIASESKKNLVTFNNMKGYKIYKQVMRDRAKG
jgi:hypothetical protein